MIPICEMNLAFQNTFYSFMSMKSSIILDIPIILVKTILQNPEVKGSKKRLFLPFSSFSNQCLYKINTEKIIKGQERGQK